MEYYPPKVAIATLEVTIKSFMSVEGHNIIYIVPSHRSVMALSEPTL
ncbi:MAG: hypothetical protein KME50_11200 [Nostoc desertorum CM1-VF14]|nr:hypothetical protein [Nostoc desertorum CM1-VF14]